jgi:hydrogenase maturation protein HypF
MFAMGREERLTELIRVRGLVQGVGFRPAVWRLAHRFGLSGWVANDGEGVLMSLAGAPADISGLVAELRRDPPPLARIDDIERTPSTREATVDFRIIDSVADGNRTGVAPDAALCPACRAEIDDRNARRHHYPFANCTSCGPRLSIINAIPYDRANTTMRAFRMCEACAAEYADPSDRRFHAQPIACAECGPRVWLHPSVPGDPIDAARSLLLAGRIVALKALGGFHLACDATNATAVERLRAAKHRDAKPFALMARDLDVIRRFARVMPEEAKALTSNAAPIVLLDATEQLPGVAPGRDTHGFMLPTTPLHHLLLRDIDRPLVMTSGNLADEPQCIDNDEALCRLSSIAKYFLLHDRPIARRVDDSLVRVMGGEARVLRRARGYAPTPIRFNGFAGAPPVLALGGELKNTFCLLRDNEAVLSHHIGDLENAATFADYRRAIDDYCELFDFAPQAIAVDRHPDYLSTRLGEGMGLPVIHVQHHHAHLAACMVENGLAPDEQVLGVILDGLGWGTDGTIWGGEFLLGDCRGFRRLACFKPIAMPGGAQAIREPWRNALAHIGAALLAEFGDTDIARYLATKPTAPLLSMIERGVNAPLASSCGRLFDAVAAAVGLCRDRVSYEGHAAMLLESAASRVTPAYTSPATRGRKGRGCGGAYNFAITETDGMLQLDAMPLWPALLTDTRTMPPEAIAARFHIGLADAIADMVAALDIAAPVALSGGVFHNRLLFELVQQRLVSRGHHVLTHRHVPAGDGGLAPGQAAIAAAQLLAKRGD